MVTVDTRQNQEQIIQIGETKLQYRDEFRYFRPMLTSYNEVVMNIKRSAKSRSKSRIQKDSRK